MKGLKEHFDGFRRKCYNFYVDKQGSKKKNNMSNKEIFGFLPIPPSRPYPSRIPTRDISLMASIFLTVFHFHFHQLLLSVGHRLSWSFNSPEIHSSVTWCRVRSQLDWENNLCISISLVRSIVFILSSIAHNDFLHPIILVVFAFTKNNLRTKTYISIACRPFDHLQWNVGPVKKGSPSVPTASLLMGCDRVLPGGKAPQ